MTTAEVPTRVSLVPIGTVAYITSLSECTIRRMMRCGAFVKPLKAGRSFRWHLDDVTAWARAGNQGSAAGGRRCEVTRSRPLPPRRRRRSRSPALRAGLETETDSKVRNWIEDLLAGDREDVKNQP